MKRASYRERDYAFGKRMLALRMATGLTQARLAGLLGVARVNAATVPTATPARAIALSLITIVRTRRCFAGAIATPAGWDAATPLTLKALAAAVPTGV